VKVSKNGLKCLKKVVKFILKNQSWKYARHGFHRLWLDILVRT